MCTEHSPGDGGQLLLSQGIYTSSFQQQREIKVYLYSGGFGHCRRSNEGCGGPLDEEIRVPGPGTQLGDL